MKPTKAPDTRRITSLRLDPEILIRLRAMAIRERRSVNDIMTAAIEEYVGIYERRHMRSAEVAESR